LGCPNKFPKPPKNRFQEHNKKLICPLPAPPKQTLPCGPPPTLGAQGGSQFCPTFSTKKTFGGCATGPPPRQTLPTPPKKQVSPPRDSPWASEFFPFSLFPSLGAQIPLKSVFDFSRLGPIPPPFFPPQFLCFSQTGNGWGPVFWDFFFFWFFPLNRRKNWGDLRFCWAKGGGFCKPPFFLLKKFFSVWRRRLGALLFLGGGGGASGLVFSNGGVDRRPSLVTKNFAILNTRGLVRPSFGGVQQGPPCGIHQCFWGVWWGLGPACATNFFFPPPTNPYWLGAEGSGFFFPLGFSPMFSGGGWTTQVLPRGTPTRKFLFPCFVVPRVSKGGGSLLGAFFFLRGGKKPTGIWIWPGGSGKKIFVFTLVWELFFPDFFTLFFRGPHGFCEFNVVFCSSFPPVFFRSGGFFAWGRGPNLGQWARCMVRFFFVLPLGLVKKRGGQHNPFPICGFLLFHVLVFLGDFFFGNCHEGRVFPPPLLFFSLCLGVCFFF